MRLTDTDVLMSKIKATFCEECNNGIRCVACAISDVLSDIENSPIADTESTTHWTNIDEVMPETGVMVLMHRSPKFTAVMSLKYWDDRFWWENHRGEITEVYDNDYWMPLPESPKE